MGREEREKMATRTTSMVGRGLRGGVGNGGRVYMKQKYSLNVQIIPGERENFEVSEKRFDREVLNAGVTRELRRRQQFENTQDIKKRKIEEKKFRRRFANRNHNSGPVS